MQEVIFMRNLTQIILSLIVMLSVLVLSTGCKSSKHFSHTENNSLGMVKRNITSKEMNESYTNSPMEKITDEAVSTTDELNINYINNVMEGGNFFVSYTFYTEDIVPYLSAYSFSLEPDTICDALSDYFSEPFTYQALIEVNGHRESNKYRMSHIEFNGEFHHIIIEIGKPKTIHPTCKSSYINGTECNIFERLGPSSEEVQLRYIEYTYDTVPISIRGYTDYNNSYTQITIKELTDIFLQIDDIIQ